MSPERSATAAARAAAAALLLLAAACAPDAGLPTLRVDGTAMGTSWSVLAVAPPGHVDGRTLASDLEALLERIEDAMSTWRPESELSRFNASSGPSVPVSRELCDLVAAALDLAESTGGAFDVTVGPLVDLWGFGPGKPVSVPPAAADIEAVRRIVGYRRVRADCGIEPTLHKDVPGLRIDLSAYAKGYAVDRAAELLAGRGVENYMVEIGGELRVAGVNPGSGPWRIAVEKPLAGGRSVEAVLPVTDCAVATSGDYRNYFEHAGRRYSHTLDPRTGYPISHAGASVSIIAESAAYADAMATALLVMGPEAGIAYADERGIAAYVLVRRGENFEARSSAAFRRAGYLQ